MSAPNRMAVGVVVERRKAASQWIDYVWQPVSVLPGRPEAEPWTVLSQEAERTIFYAGTTTIELYPTETTNYRDNLASGNALAMGRAAANRGGSALHAVRGHGGSCRRRSFYRSRYRSDRDGTHAGIDPRSGGGFCCRVSCRATILQTQARSRQYGSDGAARAGPRGRPQMSDPKDFLTRWSQRKLNPPAEKPAPEEKAPMPAADREAAATAPIDPEFDITTLPSLEVDHGQFRHQSLSAARRAGGAEPCGPSPRLECRSGDPGFCRSVGEFLGLQRAGFDTRDLDRLAAPMCGAWRPSFLASRARKQPANRRPGSRHSPNRL